MVSDIQVSLHFSKVHVTPLCFYRRPTLVPVSLTKRNPKRIFASTKRGGKQKQWSFVSYRAIIEAAGTQHSESGLAKLLPGNHTQNLSIRPL